MENKKTFFDNKFIILIFIAVMILCSGHAFYTIFPLLKNVSAITTIICLIPITGVLRTRRIDSSVGAFLIFFGMTLVAIVLELGKNFSYYIVMLCMVFTAFAVAQLYDFQKMVRVYLNIMVVVTIVGVVGHFLINNTSLLNSLPIYSSMNDFDYRVGIIFNSMTLHPDRNCGMFWEPGLFATYIAIAMVFEILFPPKGRPSWWHLIVFVIGMLTTTSSAGYVLMVLCAILLLTCRQRKKSDTNAFWSVVKFVLFVTAILVLMNYEVILESTGLAKNEYVQKLFPENIIESSRAQALSHNFKTFFKSPLFGVGITQAYGALESVADTSTSTFALSVFGIPGAAYTFYWLYAIFKDKTTNLYSKVVFAAIILSILNKEPHLSLLFTWCLLFWLLRRVGDQKKEEADV